MPPPQILGSLSTFSNPGGTPIATSADEYYQRQVLADQARNGQDAQLAAMLAMNGTFADKTAAAAKAQSDLFAHQDSANAGLYANNLAVGKQSGDYGLKNIYAGNVPEMTRQQNLMTEYNNTREDNASDRELHALSNQALIGGYKDYLGNAPAPGAPAPTPNVMSSLFNNFGLPNKPAQFSMVPNTPGYVSPTGTAPTVPGDYSSVFSDAAYPKAQATASAPLSATSSIGGGPAHPQDAGISRALQLAYIRDPAAAIADARAETTRRNNRLDVASAAQSKSLSDALDRVRSLQRTDLIAPITDAMDYIATNGIGKPEFNDLINKASELNASESNQLAANEMQAWRASPQFAAGIQDILDVAKLNRNGTESISNVLAKADALAQTIASGKGSHISLEQAKQLIGEQMQAGLPGLGRDILSGIGSVAASVVDPRVWSGARDPNANVGNASALRNALMNSGYTLRDSTLPTVQAANDMIPPSKRVAQK